MEANFSYNLALEDFARLSHRSLSTFKRDAQSVECNETYGSLAGSRRLLTSADARRAVSKLKAER
jgi:hypothetical protein